MCTREEEKERERGNEPPPIDLEQERNNLNTPRLRPDGFSKKASARQG